MSQAKTVRTDESAGQPEDPRQASLRVAFGRRLKMLRHHRVTSQKALAQASGVSLNTIGSIERGLRFPSPEVLESLATALEIEVRDLFDVGEHAEPTTLEGAARELRRVVETELLPQVEQLTHLVGKLLNEVEALKRQSPGRGPAVAKRMPANAA